MQSTLHLPSTSGPPPTDKLSPQHLGCPSSAAPPLIAHPQTWDAAAKMLVLHIELKVFRSRKPKCSAHCTCCRGPQSQSASSYSSPTNMDAAAKLLVLHIELKAFRSRNQMQRALHCLLPAAGGPKLDVQRQQVMSVQQNV